MSGVLGQSWLRTPRQQLARLVAVEPGQAVEDGQARGAALAALQGRQPGERDADLHAHLLAGEVSRHPPGQQLGVVVQSAQGAGARW